MSRTLTIDQTRRLRLQAQHLARAESHRSAADVVRQLFALQSQEWPSAQLAIHARCPAVLQTDVLRAREVERAFVLTWTLRGTLHLVAADDLHWQLALCGPGAIRGTGSRYKQLGLTEEIRERALDAIQAILSGENALIRSQLAQALESRGIPVAGQAIHHLVRYAALRGLVCLGPEIDGDLSYVLLDEWLPGAKAPLPDDPLPAFARRYLAAYGPATLADFKRWSGLATAQVKAAWKAIGSECAAVTLPDGEALMLKEQLGALETETDETTVRLLPRYDNYLLGYERRAFMVADAYAKRVHPGGGLLRACVLIDGVARANWKLEKRRKVLRVKVSPFETLTVAEAAQLEAEVESLGAFLNTSAELHIEDA